MKIFLWKYNEKTLKIRSQLFYIRFCNFGFLIPILFWFNFKNTILSLKFIYTRISIVITEELLFLHGDEIGLIIK